jgi:hypothetical protein
MIYTGYFSRLKMYRDFHLKLISIANHSPFTSGDLSTIKFLPLTPGSWIYSWKNDFKNRPDISRAKQEYINMYYREYLNKFDPDKLFKEINDFAKAIDIVLLCYEAPPKQMGPDGIIDLGWLEVGRAFCHRHIVADFLRQGGYPCQEYCIDVNNGGGYLFE